MTAIEKAAPDGKSIQNGKETSLMANNTLPIRNNSIRVGAGQWITDYIPHGSQNAITGTELSKLLSCDLRDITKSIQRARLHGAPICSSSGTVPGYFQTDDPGELARYIKSLDHRTKEITATRDALAVTMDGLSGQNRMEGF